MSEQLSIFQKPSEFHEELLYGKEYRLYVPQQNCYGPNATFKAVYFGQNPVTTKWFLQPQNLEGHVFARLNELGKLTLYHDRNTGLYAKQLWFYEGDDGQSYPVGFPAELFKGSISNTVLNYVTEQLIKRTGQIQPTGF